jgi:hypothetical protein
MTPYLAALAPGEADVTVIIARPGDASIIARPDRPSSIVAPNRKSRKRNRRGAAGDLTVVRPAAAAPLEQVEQIGRHRAAQPRARVHSEHGER